MNAERTSVDERAEAYLEGALPADEAAAFERDLASLPEVAQALSAAIVLRELLGQLPPLAPPAGLEERIVGALRLGGAAERGDERREAAGEGASVTGRVAAALRGTSWLFRPTTTAVTGGMWGARPIAAGLGQVRWALGPLAARRAEGEPAPRRSALRRVLGGLGRLGGLG